MKPRELVTLMLVGVGLWIVLIWTTDWLLDHVL